ncbi:MAG: nicotinate (nicotinamide) nucleotide adenylyltransferase [Deltaproteobacteria bacterium]|nr:nicotinate (nicotinamide) nucleotide adenylyltransferase [Deltaproteobacteria bacterium]
MNVAFYGGSFDPPHLCHVLSVSMAMSVESLDRVLVVPCLEHVFRKNLTAFHHRVAMARLAFSQFGDRVEISEVEAGLPAPSRTLDTLVHLQAQHPDWKLRLLIGSDILGETKKWYRFDEVARLAPPLVIPRLGYPGGENVPPLPDISSTRARELLREGRPPGTLLPLVVARYVEEHGLYQP